VVASGAALLIATLGAVLLYRRRAPGHHATEAPRELAAEPSLFESRAEVNPADPEHQRELAAEYQRQAGSDRAGGRVALAASGYRQAIDALAQRVTLDPGNPTYQHDLAVAITELAELDADQGWTAQAAAGYQRAVELGEHLIQADPGNPAYRRTLDLARARKAALDIV
jgi:tetratricopeptide (TPR) repeat protein